MSVVILRGLWRPCEGVERVEMHVLRNDHKVMINVSDCFKTGKNIKSEAVIDSERGVSGFTGY